MQSIPVDKVRQVINDRRRAALANARDGEAGLSWRATAGAEAHALTLVLRDLGLEDEHGNELEPAACVCPSHPHDNGPCEPMPSEPGRCVYGEHPMGGAAEDES